MAGFDPRVSYDVPTKLYESGGLYDGFSYPGPNNTDWIVEIAFDLSVNGFGSFFTLDDPVRGVLDNSSYLLAGDVLVDVTRWVREININRGRSRRLDKFTAGTCSLVLANEERLFDPFMVGGPFYGQLKPRKEMRIRFQGEYLFVGNIEEWKYDYDVNRKSVALPSAVDGMALLSRTNYVARTEVTEGSVDRVTKVLDRVGWATDRRDFQVSTSIDAPLYADTHADVSALTYLQDIETSEIGKFFITRRGYASFCTSVFTQPARIPFGPTGVPYSDISVASETDRMQNVVTVKYAGASTGSYTNTSSVTEYGQLVRDYTTLLADAGSAANFGANILTAFAQPVYYFDKISFNMLAVPSKSVPDIVTLDLYSQVALTFTPAGVGAPVQFLILDVNSITHKVAPKRHEVEIGLSPANPAYTEVVGI